jgi:hypothetical protein
VRCVYVKTCPCVCWTNTSFTLYNYSNGCHSASLTLADSFLGSEGHCALKLGGICGGHSSALLPSLFTPFAPHQHSFSTSHPTPAPLPLTIELPLSRFGTTHLGLAGVAEPIWLCLLESFLQYRCQLHTHSTRRAFLPLSASWFQSRG